MQESVSKFRNLSLCICEGRLAEHCRCNNVTTVQEEQTGDTRVTLQRYNLMPLTSVMNLARVQRWSILMVSGGGTLDQWLCSCYSYHAAAGSIICP